MKKKARKLEVSIIVPIYNSEKTIGKTIKSLLNQNYPKNKYEIILVDDGSTDGTVEVVKKFKGVKLILQKHAGPAIARNRGARHSKGKMILFTDADCIANRNWVESITKPFEDKKIVGVAGTYKAANKRKIMPRFISYEIEDRHNSMKGKYNIDFVGTFSAAYRRDVFVKFGGFDENFNRASGEDTDLSFKISKAGGRIVLVPDAYVYHHHTESLMTMLKKKFWMGYWRIFLYRKHKDKLFRHTYTPKSVFIEEGLLGLTFLLFIARLFGIVPLSFMFYPLILAMLLVLPLSFRIFRKDKLVGLLAPWIILLRDTVVGFGILAGIFAFLIKR